MRVLLEELVRLMPRFRLVPGARPITLNSIVLSVWTLPVEVEPAEPIIDTEVLP
jgi:hypothetical protein